MKKLVILICVVIGVVIYNVYKKRQKSLADYEMAQTKENIELRTICAIQYCLLKEGLTINIKCLHCTLYFCKDKENFNDFQDDFNSFIDNYQHNTVI